MRSIFYFYKYCNLWNRNKSEWVLKYQKHFAFALVILMVFSIIIHEYNPVRTMMSLQSKRSETIMRQLNEISLVAREAVNNPENIKQQTAALKSIENTVVILQKSFGDVAKTSDIQGVSKQITSVKEDIDAQMSDIKKSVLQNADGKFYLDPSILPFHVISVDVIAGQPYVSINYANHISPLGMNNTIAGWRLMAADYDASTAEFVNEKNQYIKVSTAGN